MKAIVALVAIASCAGAVAQTTPQPVRIPVRHADPWAIVMLLQGQPLVQPEISSLLGFMGLPSPPPLGGMGTLLVGGKVFVNPTDNSIWFVPDKN